MTTAHPIATVPLDTPVLMFGPWGWMEPSGPPCWRVGVAIIDPCETDGSLCYQSDTDNPYSDVCAPTHWTPLPQNPE